MHTPGKYRIDRPVRWHIPSIRLLLEVPMARQRTMFSLLAATFVVTAVACGDDSTSTSSTTATAVTTAAAVTTDAPATSAAPATTAGPATTAAGATTTVPADAGGISVDGISPERCEANKAAGKITYLTGFDFAAASSIVEVVVAEKKGYFDKLCLDVELKPSFSTANYPLVSANEAQFSSAGSFTEVADFADKNKADLVVLSVDGRTAIDTLIAKADKVTDYPDLKGTTIGVKGKLPPSIKALLASHDLVEGTDYKTVLIDGFDPKVHIALPSIVAFPGWKSNEPGQLEAAGVKFNTFDPTKEGIPGSFGLIYSNAKFITEHPTAAQDFMRAAMKGLEDALADPDGAAQICVDAINANGNKNFLSPEGEKFRWNTEAALIKELTPAGVPFGLPDPAALDAEVAAYAAAGVFDGGATPPTAGRVDATLLAGIYDADGKVIFPA